MNDRDWMKRFRRGRKGGCAAWLAAASLLLICLLRVA